MIPALATIVAAYVAFRMLEVFCFPRERYSGAFAHHAATLLAFLVLFVTAVMMSSIYSAELATTRELNAERSAAALLAQALRDAQDAAPAAPAPAVPRKKTYPQHNTGWVERVIDGDTFVLNSGERIRILDIDAPELADPGGPAARDFLLAMIDGTVVRLDRKSKDRYGRTLAEVFLVKDGTSIAKALLDSQNATPYHAK